MFDIGFWEMCMIGIVGLLVIGPERLPGVARSIGRWVGKAQRMVASVKSDINREMESGELRDLIGEQRKQIEQLQSVVNDTRTEFETSARETVGSAQESLNEAKAAISDSGSDAPAPASGGNDDRKSA